MTNIRVGRFSISRTQAEDWLLDCTVAHAAALGYPAYEQYRAADWSGPLEEADLLAPALFEAAPSPAAFSWLRSRLPVLNQALESIAPNADLAESDAPLRLIAPLFEVLAAPGGQEVGPATLTKILHRKRPRFVPLWDPQIGLCYRHLSEEASPGRFASALAEGVREDLIADPQTWQALARIADRPAITPLRALGIVAWHLGAGANAVPEPRATASV